jgi:hypothetical protein
VHRRKARSPLKIERKARRSRLPRAPVPVLQTVFRIGDGLMRERTGHVHFWQDVPQGRKKKAVVWEHAVECADCGVVLVGAEASGDRDVEAMKKLKRLGKVP